MISKLSRKLLLISQLTEELNCIVSIFSYGYIVYDARRGKIIRHGTEQSGLYYIDEVIQNGHAMLTYGSIKQKL